MIKKTGIRCGFVGIIAFFVCGAIGMYAFDAYAAIKQPLGAYEQLGSKNCKNDGFAHIVPCGRHCNDPATSTDETDPCTMCHFVVLGHNIVTYILYIAVFAALAAITFAGVVYIVSAGDGGMMSKAKEMLKIALFGMAWVLAAWVVINTLITQILPTNATGNWFNYQCGKETGSAATTTPSASQADVRKADNAAAAAAAPTDANGNLQFDP